jgi:hypothetical protein
VRMVMSRSPVQGKVPPIILLARPIKKNDPGAETFSEAETLSDRFKAETQHSDWLVPRSSENQTALGGVIWNRKASSSGY